VKIEEALAIFGFDAQRDILPRVRCELDCESVRLEIVKECAKRYREKILRAHPDVGGNHAEASLLNQAMDLVRRLEIKVPARPPMMVVQFFYQGSTTSTTNTGWWGATNA
jgi:hypothetical protein